MINLTITNSLLDDKIINSLNEKELQTMNKTDLQNHYNKPIITITDHNNDIISIAFVLSNNDYDVSLEIKEQLGWLYENDFEWLENNIARKLKNNGITIKAIESFIEGTGTGTHIVNTLKSEYNSIFLYAANDAETYWEKQGFENIGEYNYLWKGEAYNG